MARFGQNRPKRPNQLDPPHHPPRPQNRKSICFKWETVSHFNQLECLKRAAEWQIATRARTAAHPREAVLGVLRDISHAEARRGRGRRGVFIWGAAPDPDKLGALCLSVSLRETKSPLQAACKGLSFACHLPVICWARTHVAMPSLLVAIALASFLRQAHEPSTLPASVPALSC